MKPDVFPYCTPGSVFATAHERARFWQYPERADWTVSLSLVRPGKAAKPIEVHHYADGRMEVLS